MSFELWAQALPRSKPTFGGKRGERGTGRRGGRGKHSAVQCSLCPHRCLIEHGQSGDCRVRINYEGVLYAVTFGRPCAVHLDPIEKKPLFHVLPGSRILSIATAGCNLHCRNCQNAAISQANPEDVRVKSWSRTEYGIAPKRLVELCERRSLASIAYTYTEPVVYYEYVYETAQLARQRGLKNVTVTAGYINEKPLRRLAKLVDASNVDLKTMNPDLFRKNSGGELEHVLDGLVIAREEGVWLEITNLLIPTLNDSPTETRKLCRWVKKHLGADTPLHLSRFYPHHELRNLPPTPLRTLTRARDIAKEEGLRYVYVGNVRGNPSFESTYCPSCGGVVIGRTGFTITEESHEHGKCSKCGHQIAGVWR